VYIDEDVFDEEMRTLFYNSWVFIGHDSQIPKSGDFYTTTVGTQPVIMVRHTDASIKVLYNRCAHKGVKLVSETSGNTGRIFTCPYHAWSYKTDGSLSGVPLPRGYQNTSFDKSSARAGLGVVENVRNYRGFVFGRLSSNGIGFDEFFGKSLSTLDNMIDRSPAGRLEVTGGMLPYMHHCNWKMLVDNQTDTCHPISAHGAAVTTAVRLASTATHDEAGRNFAVEVIAPFGGDLKSLDEMGLRVWWGTGHGHTGVSSSIHAGYSAVPGYYDLMVGAYGKDRADAILNDNRHNQIYFPNILVKAPVQILRLFKPIAVDKTLVESWVFRLVDAPDVLLERAHIYNRLINSPASIVGNDDLEMYERAQEGLRVNSNPWVNIQRLYQPGEDVEEVSVLPTTSEAQMRNQFKTWLKFMEPAP